LRKQRQEQQVADESTGTPSSDIEPPSPAAGDGVGHCDDTHGADSATAAITAADRQQYVDWETMQKM